MSLVFTAGMSGGAESFCAAAGQQQENDVYGSDDDLYMPGCDDDGGADGVDGAVSQSAVTSPPDTGNKTSKIQLQLSDDIFDDSVEPLTQDDVTDDPSSQANDGSFKDRDLDCTPPKFDKKYCYVEVGKRSIII